MTANRAALRVPPPAVATLLVVAGLWVVGLFVLPGAAGQHLSNFGLAGVALLAGVTAWLRARQHIDSVARFWRFLGLAALSWSAGQLVWTYYESLRGQTVPFPSLADIGYLGLPPLAAAALLSLPLSASSTAGRVRTVLDGLMVAAALLLCSWIIVLGPVLRSGAESVPALLISLAYPIGDVIVITLVLYTWLQARRLHRGQSSSLPLVGMGLLAFAVADSGFTYLTTVEAYRSGNVIDIGWFAGFVLMSVAALRPDREEAARTEHEPTSRPIGDLLPYAAVSIALLTSVIEMLRTGDTDAVVSWIRSAIMGLLVARQILTMRENHALALHLEQRVEERTAELRRSRNAAIAGLQREAEAVQQLQELDRAKDDFVATVSHELRTPITSIKGYVELILEASPDHLTPVHASMLRTVQRNSDRLASLAENLLTAAKLESGELHMDLRPVDLAEVVRRIEDALRPVVGERDLEVCYAVPSEPVVVNGDMGYLERVLFNLMSNALKFSEDGGSILCRAARCGDQAVLEVTDTGIGIPAEEQQHLFTRFFRSSTARQQAIQGSGLGLAIASAIVSQHGGQIDVESARGRGTRVRVRLPASVVRSVAV